MTSLLAAPSTRGATMLKPWQLPARGLAVFHGQGETARLSHYFLPRVLVEGKRVLYLDGANQIDPFLIARFARQRGYEPSDFATLNWPLLIV